MIENSRRFQLSLVAAGDRALKWIRDNAANARSALKLSEVTLLAPIPRPRKNVFCVGWNYLEHFREGEKIRPHVAEMPTHPTFFSKTPTTVIQGVWLCSTPHLIWRPIGS